MTVLPGQSCESWGNRATLGSRGPGSEEDLGGGSQKASQRGGAGLEGPLRPMHRLGFRFLCFGETEGRKVRPGV